ncbi:MAG: peptidoglycan editing factor PgeF [Betaproteobacteria bacterium]|nr:MAG: peptidoglycan editing factor PgeF [Betaproteobacteria bacterium]
MELIRPDWPAPANVKALVTTRPFGDMAADAPGRASLRAHLPAEPKWLRQVHGNEVIDADSARGHPQADAAVARRRGTVCSIMIADCMPVILADASGSVVGVAHAGWRGLSSGVIEATVRAMGSRTLIAWLGPAIGPRVYEVGDEVRAAFLPGERSAFVATRPGHWLLDLYAVARQRLESSGVKGVYGGGFCTYSEPERFFSYRRERASGRMAALVWLT